VITARRSSFGPDARGWSALFALYTAIGAFGFWYRYLDDLAREHYDTLARRLLEESSGTYTAFALLPLILALCRRLPWSPSSWPRTIALHLLGALAYSFAHTTLMALSRAVLFPLAGMGSYDYGNMLYRYPMELSNDVTSYAIVAGFVYFIERIRLAREGELRAAHLQMQLAEAKLENLQLHLQPHFLFNTLNTISAVMYEDVRVADRMIGRLSELLRATLYASDRPEATLADELHVAELYLDIMRARLENHLDVQVRVEAALREALVPTMILQPLLENAIKHGLSPDNVDLQIDVEAERSGDVLTVRVADTGIGLRARPEREAGLGIANTRHRLRELYGDDGTVRLSDRAGGGAEVVITLPYHAHLAEHAAR
jgi:signal transduction histidine kinase